MAEKGFEYKCGFADIKEARRLIDKYSKAGWKASMTTRETQGITIYEIWAKKPETK